MNLFQFGANFSPELLAKMARRWRSGLKARQSLLQPTSSAELSYGQGEKSLIQKLVQKCTFNGNLQPGVASATATGVFPARKPRNKGHKVAKGKKGFVDGGREQGIKRKEQRRKVLTDCLCAKWLPRMRPGCWPAVVCLWPWFCATGNGNCVAQPSALLWCKNGSEP